MENSWHWSGGKNPKQLDLAALSGPSKDNTDMALYKLEGNKLAIYTLVGPKAQEKRPTAYPTKQTEDDFDFFELERTDVPRERQGAQVQGAWSRQGP